MKIVEQITTEQAAAKITSGDVLIVGGFGMTGNPVHLLNAIAETDVMDITYVGNNIGEPGLGGGRMLRNGQISKAIGSYFTSNREAVAAAAVPYIRRPYSSAVIQLSQPSIVRQAAVLRGRGTFQTPPALQFRDILFELNRQ